jgi:hypothetical protein
VLAVQCKVGEKGMAAGKRRCNSDATDDDEEQLEKDFLYKCSIVCYAGVFLFAYIKHII